MFPIPWNFPFRKKNGNLVNIGDAIDEGTELPVHGEGDAGKVLIVDENGNLEWSDEVSAEIQTLTNNLSDEVETRAKVSAHNLLPFDLDECKALNTTGTWSGDVYSVNGITFTVNADGIISADGTASSEANIAITQKFSVKAGESYTLNGGLNNDGTSTQRIWVSSNNAFPSGHRLTTYNAGTGAKSTQDALANESNITVYIQIFSGVTLSNVVFKPMVRLASDLNSEFAPYAMTNRELTFKEISNTVSGVTEIFNAQECIIDFNNANLGNLTDSWTTVCTVSNKPQHPINTVMIHNSYIVIVYIGTSGNVQMKTQDGNTHEATGVNAQLRYTLI